MIPKKIHYCWFGRGDMPELAIKCINSWKKYLPDYELVLWNEDTFDVSTNQYVREAYEKKRYAFVTDYVRLYALYNHGGVYMDTDVEVIKSLDRFLGHRAFTGCENDKMCVTGTMSSEKGHPWIKLLLDEYKDKRFILDNGRLNTLTNTQAITRATTTDYNWAERDEYQVLKEDLHIYPSDFFCAKDLRTGKITITDDTHTIHHFSGSWLTDAEKKSSQRKSSIKSFLVKIIGEKGFEKLSKIRKAFLNK